MTRATWGSRIGFILAAAGSAVGLGAIWKFPYVSAKNGGGAFLIIFLIMSFTLGICIMIAEMLMGQISRKSPVGAYRFFGGKPFSLAGYMGVLCGFIILSFYSVVGGWTLFYLGRSFQSGLLTSDVRVLKTIFETFVENPYLPILCHALFMGITAAIIVCGIQKGIERISKTLMALLFLVLLILLGRSLTLEGAIDGVLHFIVPDFSKLSAEMFLDAMGLAFFSLSLGMGCMMTYGSYVNRDTNVATSAVCVTGLTIGISFLVGLMILPAVYVFGLNPAEGPGLTFIVMPAVFSYLLGGTYFAILFFFLLFVAALTSSISLMEVSVSFFIDEFATPRKLTTVILAIVMFTIGIFASLSLGVLKEFTFFGKTLFGLMDYCTSNIMMPLGALMTSVVVGWRSRKMFQDYLSDGVRYPKWFSYISIFCRFVAPFLILIILFQNL